MQKVNQEILEAHIARLKATGKLTVEFSTESAWQLVSKMRTLDIRLNELVRDALEFYFALYEKAPDAARDLNKAIEIINVGLYFQPMLAKGDRIVVKKKGDTEEKIITFQ